LRGPLLLAAVVVALAACSDRTTDTSASGAADAADTAIATCLERAGFGMSLENVYVRQRDDPAFADSLQRCAAATGVSLPDFEAIRAAVDGERRALVECLRELGWSVPDPQVGEGGFLVLDGFDGRVPPSDRATFYDDVGDCGGAALPGVPGGE
jgi:hypothetical protein